MPSGFGFLVVTGVHKEAPFGSFARLLLLRWVAPDRCGPALQQLEGFGCQWYLVPDQRGEKLLDVVHGRRCDWPCSTKLIMMCSMASWVSLLGRRQGGPLGMPVADGKHTFGFFASLGGWCAAPCGRSSEVAAALLLCSPVVPCLPNGASRSCRML